MAMMDDRQFLISHIRQSFITSDDTGMCEIIIEPEEEMHRAEKAGRPTTWHGNQSTEDILEHASGSATDSGMESDTELAHSPDIVPDMDFASHRRRSNTAQRLEKLKRDKHKQSQIKHVQWKNTKITADDMAEHFEKKTLGTSMSVKHTSALSVRLDEHNSTPTNPYVEYARFDGMASGGLPIKKIGIFLTMVEGDERNYPMMVNCVTSAKIHELIGLICWQYNNEGHHPILKNNVESYTLHIAEDDGEVDLDFPALDNQEPVSKFGFSKLALVEKEVVTPVNKSSLLVTINMPNRGFATLSPKADTVLMRELLEQVLKHRRLKQRAGLEYRLEKQAEAGQVIDLDKPLSSMTTHEFCLVRENSMRGDIDISSAAEEISDMARSLSSHQYRSYKVTMTAKLVRGTEVQLGVSGEKIEIDPVQSKGLFLKQKASTYDTENVAACFLVDDKISTKLGKSTFRLVYHTGTDFRHHDFECETGQATEITGKINNIMDMRANNMRKEYLAYKEHKKMQNPFKRHSLGLS